MFCPYCGKDNDPDNAFCQYCGQPMPAKKPQPVEQAVSPATVLTVPEASPEPVRPEPAQVTIQVETVSPGLITCLQCGQAYQSPCPPYCLTCGYPLNPAAAQPRPTDSSPWTPRPAPTMGSAKPLAITLPWLPGVIQKVTRASRVIQKALQRPSVRWAVLAVAVLLIAGFIWIRSRGSQNPTFLTSGPGCQPVTPGSAFELANTHDLSGRLRRDSYFEAGETYNISENETFVVPSGITLIIQPGAIVRFGSGARMVVQGQLLACGKSSRRILFTADARTGRPGYWQGIVLDNADRDTVIGHATFEFAGMNYQPVLMISGVNPELEDLKFDSNQYYSLSVTPDSFPRLRLPYTVENGPEGWEIRDGNLNKDLTWDAVQPLVINGVLTIGEKATLTVAAGSHVKFLPNSQIQVYGKIRAIGTSSEHIRITAASELLESGGSSDNRPWSGLTLRGKRAEAEMNYVDYRYEVSEDDK